MSLTHEQERELRELCEKATPGPWRDDVGCIRHDGTPMRMAGIIATCTDRHHPSARSDTAFIAAARSGLPAALDTIAELKKENEALRGRGSMDLAERRVIYRRAIERWGVESQVAMLQEECIELALQCARVLRGRARLETLAEEMADVLNMIDQITPIVSETAVERWREKKLERLQKRMMGSLSVHVECDLRPVIADLERASCILERLHARCADEAEARHKPLEGGSES